ncbi:MULTISPECIES: ATP-binding protein [unclassified Pseudomonas]|uniref:ATP-binding protein n=1 Tax=unclassified Pseudomonas TaxID=196821 RepID=UPI00129E5384|nr:MULTISPECIES: ATP-binding protein [unclassified Pseudomonas]MDH4652630.1 ATP-binding protein [Pseudomonas sp. BN606]MRK20504.1 ATP-binding protein [Pseudomonas sp. JG-B]
MNNPFTARTLAEPVAFLPGVHGTDIQARHWLSQVTLRLRREVCWLWRERAQQGAAEGVLPAPVDAALAALDLLRYEHDKRRFFAEDVTARYLDERIATLAPADETAPPRGSFGWVAQQLELAPVERFVLALALLPGVDSAAGPVIASCLNDLSRTSPNLALAQRLWDEPDELLRCFDPSHPLLRHGLLATAQPHDWNSPLFVPALVARELLFPASAPPASLQPVAAVRLAAAMEPAAARVRAALTANRGVQLLPLLGAAGAPLAETAAACTALAGVETLHPSTCLPREHLASAMSCAWLRGSALYLPAKLLVDPTAHDGGLEPPPLPGLPLLVFIGAHERSALHGLGETLPALEVPPADYGQRLDYWRGLFPDTGLAPLLPELARRFRYERTAIERVAGELASLGRLPSASELFTAARADLDLGALAQPVVPRFSRDELMLPAAQAAQVDELVTAMHNLTRVHFDWGTARAWNEGGLSALFAGPPGTGKTMAAEAIAAELSLPLYRIDLSQVVNKYIGETEKNLRRLFDAADSADLILFFDEADALFGKRTEVKDAHDRYANLEISYLLERMERFKGLAILATNRRKDLDEAFLRRLRIVIEFPLPGVEERLRIWRSVIPASVDASSLDFDFLAQRFALAGGHIRGVVFNACLQSAAEGAPRRLDMPAVVRALQREYDKLDRANSLDQFGPYAALAATHRTRR